MTRKIRIGKADSGDGAKLFRLTEIDPEFVSLVCAGANRQKSFMVVKEDDEIPEDFDLAQLDDYLEKFTGSPRNRFGTHSSYKFKGDYAKAWRLHFSQHADGKPDATSTGPIRGTVRRVEMIAAAMKPACKLPSTDQIDARSGDASPLPGTYPEAAADYGIDKWDEPEDEKDRDGMKLSCSDLEVIKRAALAEVKRRAEDAAAENKTDNGDGDVADKAEGNEGGDATNADGDSADGNVTDLTSWLDEAGAAVEDLSLDLAIQRALDGQSKGGDDAGAEADQAHEIGNTGAPPVKKVGGEARQGDDRDARIAKLEAELEEARSETRKARREATALKARIARLSKGVGKSSVILTGEVTAKDAQHTDAEVKSPSRGAFLSGGDIAAAVADE